MDIDRKQKPEHLSGSSNFLHFEDTIVLENIPLNGLKKQIHFCWKLFEIVIIYLSYTVAVSFNRRHIVDILKCGFKMNYLYAFIGIITSINTNVTQYGTFLIVISITAI